MKGWVLDNEQEHAAKNLTDEFILCTDILY